jgi:nitrate/nitrite-specific signal transduction histidine kinase
MTSMQVLVHIDAATEALKPEIRLDIFRIVEQSVFNSLVHGPASRFRININTDPTGATEILVSNDGLGLSIEEVKPGVGSAIIDSWLGILNGSKEIDTISGHGYQIKV